MNTNIQTFDFHTTAYAPIHPTLLYRLIGYMHLVVLALLAILLVLCCIYVWKKISN